MQQLDNVKKGELLMKKEYKKPLAEVIKFGSEDVIMDDTGLEDDDDLGFGNESVPDEW